MARLGPVFGFAQIDPTRKVAAAILVIVANSVKEIADLRVQAAGKCQAYGMILQSKSIHGSLGPPSGEIGDSPS